jgi:hypothetical protein
MRKLILLVLLLLCIPHLAIAGTTEEYHTFFTEYDPVSNSFVYNQAASTSTGDFVAVNTYTRKSIQITGVAVGEDIRISIEGRSKDQLNPRSYLNSGVANWAILDTVDFGSASADNAINTIVDVTEFVDFIRIGIKTYGATGTSAIDIKGLFTNLER